MLRKWPISKSKSSAGMRVFKRLKGELFLELSETGSTFSKRQKVAVCSTTISKF